MIIAVGLLGAILVIGGLTRAFRMHKEDGFILAWMGLIPLGFYLSLANPEDTYASIPSGAIVVATFGFLIISYLQAMWTSEQNRTSANG